MADHGGMRRAAGSRSCPVVPVAGDLLVASVALQGDAFDQTVVLLLDVGTAGAMGLVLNRLTDTPVEDILPGWGQGMSEPGLAACGGPVSTDGALCLGRLRPGWPEPEAWRRSFADVGLVPLDADPGTCAEAFGELRVFVGYAGWDPGQLDGEVAAGLWHVLPSRESDAFEADPDDLWRRVLRRVPGDLAYFSTWTQDPALN